MADNSKPGLGGAASKAIAAPAAPSAESDRRDLDRSAIEPSDRFVAVDIGALSLLAGDDPNSAPTQPLVKSFSRKGSQRNGGGGGGDATSPGGPGEKPTIVVHVAGDRGQNGHFSAAATTTPKCRRPSRRHSPWLDPRRVLFVFATLSSMGTLILLYFTLSMGKMTQGNSGA